MRVENQNFRYLIFLLLILTMTACNGLLNPIASSTLQPTLTSLSTSTIISTSILSSTSTPKPSDILSPVCPTLSSDFISVIDPAVYNNVNPGLELGVWEAIDVLHHALEVHHPQWAQYTWQDSKGNEHGLAEYFWDTSHAQIIGVNPRVFLVTSGLALDWQISTNTDFLDAIDDVGVTLNQHYWDYEFNDDLQSSYPQVVDPANYALFAFFDFDQEVLNEWCEAYIMFFGQSPLDVPIYD